FHQRALACRYNLRRRRVRPEERLVVLLDTCCGAPELGKCRTAQCWHVVRRASSRHTAAGGPLSIPYPGGARGEQRLLLRVFGALRVWDGAAFELALP